MVKLGRHLKVTGVGLGLAALLGCAGIRDSKGTIRAWSLTPQGMRLNERNGTAEIDSPPATIYWNNPYSIYNPHLYNTWPPVSSPGCWYNNSDIGSSNGPVGRSRFYR